MRSLFVKVTVKTNFYLVTGPLQIIFHSPKDYVEPIEPMLTLNPCIEYFIKRQHENIFQQCTSTLVHNLHILHYLYNVRFILCSKGFQNV